jgi:hypothetical protein
MDRRWRKFASTYSISGRILQLDSFIGIISGRILQLDSFIGIISGRILQLDLVIEWDIEMPRTNYDVFVGVTGPGTQVTDLFDNTSNLDPADPTTPTHKISIQSPAIPANQTHDIFFLRKTALTPTFADGRIRCLYRFNADLTATGGSSSASQAVMLVVRANFAITPKKCYAFVISGNRAYSSTSITAEIWRIEGTTITVLGSATLVSAGTIPAGKRGVLQGEIISQAGTAGLKVFATIGDTDAAYSQTPLFLTGASDGAILTEGQSGFAGRHSTASFFGGTFIPTPMNIAIDRLHVFTIT